MGENVTFASNGGTCDGYLAVPESGSAARESSSSRSGGGWSATSRDVADRFAAEGFVALAPDFYHGVRPTEPDEAMRLLMSPGDGQGRQGHRRCRRYLADRTEVTGTGIGTVGFCMGGSLALWTGTLAPQRRRRRRLLPGDAVGPDEPDVGQLRRASRDHPLLGGGRHVGRRGHPDRLDGDHDRGRDVDVYDYPGTQHAFFNDDRPEVYDAEASALAWERTIGLLKRRLSV